MLPLSFREYIAALGNKTDLIIKYRIILKAAHSLMLLRSVVSMSFKLLNMIFFAAHYPFSLNTTAS